MSDLRRCSRADRAERVSANAPLAPFTTFKVGGPADWLRAGAARRRGEGGARAPRARTACPSRSSAAARTCWSSDAGVRGVVIRVHGGDVQPRRRRPRPRRRRAHDQRPRPLDDQPRRRRPRSVGRHAGHGRRRDLRQRALQGAADLRAGRQRRGRRPAEAGTRFALPAADMEFGYDRSRLQRTREIVLSADFRVGRGEPAALRAVARESLAYQEADAAARIGERRLHLPEPRSRRRSRPRRHSRRRPARWSIAPG